MTALTVTSTSPTEWQVMREQANMLLKSGFLPNAIKTPESAVAVMLQGRELGIGPMAALNNINVIQGKPTISPQLMLALIHRSGKLDAVQIDGDATQCTVLLKRTGLHPHTETFTMDDAKRLGLAGKDNWQKQPAVMLRWRAVASCARVVFPDIVLGFYTADEMGADITYTDDGDLLVEPSRLDAEIAARLGPRTVQVNEAFANRAAQHGEFVNPSTGEIADLANSFEDAPVVELPTLAERERYQRGLSMARDLGVTLPVVFYSITGQEPRDVFLRRMGELGQYIQAAQADRASAEAAPDAQEALI